MAARLTLCPPPSGPLTPDERQASLLRRRAFWLDVIRQAQREIAQVETELGERPASAVGGR